MADFVFPDSDIDSARSLLNLLGSFWATTYQSRSQVLSYAGARGQVEQQTERDLLELLATKSRYTVPIFHKDNWFALRLLESERNDAQTTLLRYDDPDVAAFFDGNFQFDVPRERDFFAFPAPAELKDAPLIFNRLTSPSVSLTKGVDFVLDRVSKAVIFREDPFTNDKIAKQPIFQGGEVVDQEALVWVFMGDFDFDYVFEQFAYAIGLRLQSSSGYRDIMNAIYDALTGGTALAQVMLGFQAMTGIALVQEPVEVVEVIDVDARNTLVITDKNVYKFRLNATVIVEVGQTVAAGDPLIDGLELIELNTGIATSPLDALAIGEGILKVGFFGDLVFESIDTPLEVIEAVDNPSGFTFVSWSLGGFSMDVDKFFADMHAEGVTRNLTLAMLLDERTNKVGQPTAFNLPSTINPLEFLVANMLRNNAFVVRVKVSQTLPMSAGLHNIRQLRKIIPPHTTLLLVLELTPESESVTLDNVSESPSPFTAMEPVTEEIPATTFVDDSRIAIRVISEACQ